MLSRFQSLNDLRPPGESDEWYPALLLFPPKKEDEERSSRQQQPPSPSNLFSFLFFFPFVSFFLSETKHI
jgi:hypothetical protein